MKNQAYGLKIFTSGTNSGLHGKRRLIKQLTYSSGTKSKKTGELGKIGNLLHLLRHDTKAKHADPKLGCHNRGPFLRAVQSARWPLLLFWKSADFACLFHRKSVYLQSEIYRKSVDYAI